jgi:hypothetical protein
MREHGGVAHPVEYWKQELQDWCPERAKDVARIWPQVNERTCPKLVLQWFKNGQVRTLVKMDPRVREYTGVYKGRTHTLW